MGCWNISFWDNDEGVDFLLYLFQHMGLMPFPKQRVHTVMALGMYQKKTGATVPIKPPIVRHAPEVTDQVQRIFASITATTLARAKEQDPNFKEKFFKDKDVFELKYHDQIGLLPEHFWTLVHMHVGMPVDDIDELDKLAEAFESCWKIEEWLRNVTGATKQEIDELSRKHAPILAQGVHLYKRRMENGEQLAPMKLAFVGVMASMTMWLEGLLPEALDGKLWNIGDLKVTRAMIGQPAPVPDPLIDVPKCSSCRATSPELKCCPCGCALYCSTDCQRKDWKKSHKRLHDLRTKDRETYSAEYKDEPHWGPLPST